MVVCGDDVTCGLRGVSLVTFNMLTYTQRAEKALFKTNYKGLAAAMDWCLAHQDDADIDEPLAIPQQGQALGNASSEEAGGWSKGIVFASSDSLPGSSRRANAGPFARLQRVRVPCVVCIGHANTSILFIFIFIYCFCFYF